MKILVLGDTHLPFTNWDALAAAAEFAKKYKPDLIVQVGDFIDAYNWSLYKRAADSPSAEAEWDQTELAVKRIFKMFPKVPWKILSGNHCMRIMLRATDMNLPKKLIRTLETIFPYDFVTWHPAPKPLILDGVAFIHGDEMAGNAWQKAQRSGRSIIQGHDHVAYLQYINTFEHQIFGMSVGAFLDIESIAGRYNVRNLMKSWTGWATLEDGIPNLFPYHR